MKYNQISKCFLKLLSDTSSHSFKNNSYKVIKKKLSSYFLIASKKGILNLPLIGKIKFPYTEMGNISSFHLFGIDEIIIFIYYFIKKNKVNRVADLGANIGLHSVILSKLGYKVTSYEPDTNHINLLKKNLILNGLSTVNVIKKAVSTNTKDIIFTKIVNNTTGSFVGKSKIKTYGPIEKYKVKCENFKNILKKNDLIKIDIEGMEAKIFLSTKFTDWKNKEAIAEIGSKKNAKDIFLHAKKHKINIFSQKNKWRKIKKLGDMPTNHTEGSVIISTTTLSPWQ